MTRQPIIAGNWKMNKTEAEALSLVKELIEGIKDIPEDKMPDVVIAPVFTSLSAVSKELKKNDKIALSAQNCYFEKSGAYTGEVSIDMIKEFGAKYIIIGHSERRQIFGESDELINKKAIAILNEGLIPIICCGETLEQRDMGVTDSHIASQIVKALEGIDRESIEKVVIAYEPIWAIGTGKTCDSAEANRVIKVIRDTIAQIAGKQNADKVRILYGGSVKPTTIKEQMAQEEIDGALVGGASLKADSFVEIIKGAK